MRGIPTAELERHAEIGKVLLARQHIGKEIGVEFEAESGIGSLEYVERHLTWILKNWDETEPKEDLARAKEELSWSIAMLNAYRKDGIPNPERLQ